MNTAVVVFIIGALVGLALFLLVVEAWPQWREADRLQDEQIRDALAPGDIQRWEQGK